MGLIILAVLLLMFFGAFPAWPYARDWGYGPSGILGALLVVLLILVVMGAIPFGWSDHTAVIR